MNISIGDKAPSFTLRNTEKAEVSLSDFNDKNILVLFFPLAFTGVCTTELCSIRDNISKYESLDAQVLAISVDSLFTLEQFKKAQGYNFPLLSDFNKEVSRAYGSLYEDFVLGMKGVSKRSAFLIDKSGTVQYAEVLDDAGQQPNFDAIVEKLNSLS
ncbi:MAG: peroxiredoxin [Saprospiraceae bacterium]|jgi:peroxiredoxin